MKFKLLSAGIVCSKCSCGFDPEEKELLL